MPVREFCHHMDILLAACTSDERAACRLVVDVPDNVTAAQERAMCDESGQDREGLSREDMLDSRFPRLDGIWAQKAGTSDWESKIRMEERPPQAWWISTAWGIFRIGVCGDQLSRRRSVDRDSTWRQILRHDGREGQALAETVCHV